MSDNNLEAPPSHLTLNLIAAHSSPISFFKVLVWSQCIICYSTIFFTIQTLEKFSFQCLTSSSLTLAHVSLNSALFFLYTYSWHNHLIKSGHGFSYVQPLSFHVDSEVRTLKKCWVVLIASRLVCRSTAIDWLQTWSSLLYYFILPCFFWALSPLRAPSSQNCLKVMKGNFLIGSQW